ncbi:hypothetical protein ACFL5L_06650 [candidate division KSB1 bacterium]
MLDEQFFGDQKYHKYLTENFISIHAYKNHPQAGEDLYAKLREKYPILGTPTVLVLDSNADEIGRVLGYAGSADKYKKNLMDAYSPENSYMSLMKKHKKGSLDFDQTVTLSYKLGSYRLNELRLELLTKLAKDPKSKTVKVPYGRRGAEVTVLEYAEENIKSLKK